MKILQVIQFFSPEFGGTVNASYNLSLELSRAGHDVTIISTDYGFDKDYIDSIREKGVEVIVFPCVFNIASFLYSPGMVKWLNIHIKSFVIVHMHNFRTYQNIKTYNAANKYSVPYVLQPHGSLPLLSQKTRLKRIFDFLWGNKIKNNSSCLIAVSDIELNHFINAGVNNEKIDLIHNGVNFFSSNNFVEGVFKQQNCLDKENLILFLGRIHKLKGLEFLIHSFKMLLDENPNIKINLAIVGPDDGPKKDLEKLVDSLKIKAYVKFIDYTKNVADAYSAANVLVYPVKYEIFGLVPFEAVMCGTPVIVTKQSGCAKLIEEANCGFVVDFGDYDDLKNKMLYLINNKKENLERVTRGKDFISNNLSWSKIIKKMEKTYENSIHNL